MRIDYKAPPIRVFLAYIMGQKKLFLIDMLCALLVSAVDLAFPYVSRMSMNELLPNKMFEGFFTVMAIMAVAFVLKSVLYYIITVVGHRMGVLVEYKMRADIFAHLQELSFSFYDRRRTGDLMSRISADLFEVVELAHHGPENILICSLTIIGSLCVMFTIDARLALALTIALPLCLWFTLSQRVRMMNANLDVKRKTGVIYSSIESSISGVRTAKAFANESEERRKFDVSNVLFRESKNEFYRALGFFMSGMEFSVSILQVIIITLGGYFIMRGTMNYIDLITFTLYASAFITPIRKLAQFTETYMQGSAGLSRFVEIMREEPDIKDAQDAYSLGEIRGEVEFKDVSFHYSNGIPVLEHINLHIDAGETLAVVGPSGSGKTTLCQLLPRFYDVSGGSVMVDGHDVRSLTQESLRRSIGVIQQDVFIFAGTVMDNIRYGRPDAGDAEVFEAAKRAEVYDEIMQMPDGFDSFLGERGVMLSGGQKQRISIARVFLKNPSILILDEATSALDTVTERRVQAAFDELSRGRTSIIIAHRLSTVRHADCIAVIEDEHIIEYGTHDELIEKNGVYAELCSAQAI